jgi:hypothetical protein
MGLYNEIDKASYEDLASWWKESLPEWTDDRATVLDEIAYALVKCGPQGTQLLQADTHSSDDDKRFAALDALSHKDSAYATVPSDLQDAFYASNPRLKTVALWGFIRLEIYPLPRDELEALLQQSDERLSALAMTYLCHAYPDEAVAMLRAGLHSPNPRRREYACDVIGDWGLAELQSEMAALRNDPDQFVRQAVQSNLDMWDGQ